MSNSRSRHRLMTCTLAALGLLGTVVGCADYRSALVSNYPALAPVLGGRATPSPFTLNTGNVKGFVFGADGVKQPIPLAFVTTGSTSSFAGNPVGDALASADERDDGKNIVSLLHDFGDGKGEVACERKLRKHPSGSPDEFAKGKYVYLRPGEFFLEGVPEGIANILASFGNVASPQSAVTVYPNTTVTDVALDLNIPVPVSNEDGSTPRVIEWTGLRPETGVTVQVQVKENITGATQTRDVTVNYKPDPPDVAVSLSAPPGSGGTVIKQVNVVYSWSTPKNANPQQLPPIQIPISPKVIAAAQPTSYGPPTILTVPVGSSSIKAIFSSDNPDEQPGLIIATMQFVGQDGFAVQGKDLAPLQVAVVLRNL